MKKVVIVSLLAAATGSCVFSAAPLVLAQAAASSQQPNQITIKDPAEYNDYSSAISQSTPAAKATAIESFLQKYPSSVVKQDLLEQLMAAYQQTGDLNKTVDAANRLLQVDPNNLRALALSVYIEKSQAAGKTTPADAQPILDKAAQQAQTGLVAPKPAGLADADYQKLKSATTPIFESAIALDDENKKDYAGAIDAFKKELASYADPNQTTSGPALNDTYLLGQAYTQLTPPDYPNAVWYLTRAAHFAPAAAQPTIEKAAEYYYKKYHGNMDGFTDIQAQVATSLNPPDSYKPTAAPPPPSPADQAATLVSTTPDLKTLSLSDKEFVLFNGKTEDAEKVWAVLKGITAEIPGKVISATADSVQIAVTEDNVQANKADFTVNMKEPLKTVPAIGSSVTYVATFDSYTANPPMITLSDGGLKAAPAAKKPVARRRPAGR
jgi:hypothetical protein